MEDKLPPVLRVMAAAGCKAACGMGRIRTRRRGFMRMGRGLGVAGARQLQGKELEL